MNENFTFAITHKDNPKEVIKHVDIETDSIESAATIADDELNDYQKGLSIDIVNS